MPAHYFFDSKPRLCDRPHGLGFHGCYRQPERDAADAAKLIEVLESAPVRPSPTSAPDGALSCRHVPACRPDRPGVRDRHQRRTAPDITKVVAAVALERDRAPGRRRGDEPAGRLLRRDLHAPRLPPLRRSAGDEREPAAVAETGRPSGRSGICARLEGQRAAGEAERRQVAWRDAGDGRRRTEGRRVRRRSGGSVGCANVGDHRQETSGAMREPDALVSFGA